MIIQDKTGVAVEVFAEAFTTGKVEVVGFMVSTLHKNYFADRFAAHKIGDGSVFGPVSQG